MRVSDDVMDSCEAEMLEYADGLSLDDLAEFERVQSGAERVEPDMVRRYKQDGLGPTASGVHISTISASAGETASRVTRTPGGSHASGV